MDHFIVSARKYRPQNFSTVVGQAHITTTLKNAILQQKLAHAFLFCGPRGVGKTTCARILAKTINCENRQPDGEACNTCNSCVSFNQGASLNIHELDAASNNSVDDIRDLTDQVRFMPQAGRYKVYIIDEVHMLSQAAFNAFLKTLEEPPPYAIFILATTEKHKILPTILSRCQIFDFKRITDADTVEHLEEIVNKEHITAEKAALQVIAQKSEGCMRDALSTLDKIVSFTGGSLTYTNTLEHLNILDEDYFFRFIDHMRQQDLAGSLLLLDEINKRGFDGEMLLNELAGFFRNLLVCRDPRSLSLLEVVDSFKERYAAVAAATPMAWLIGAVNILSSAIEGYKPARNKKLHTEMAFIRLTYLSQAVEWSSEGSGMVQKKTIDAIRPVRFRKIAPIEVREPGAAAPVAAPNNPGGGARLIIETPKPAVASAPPPAPPASEAKASVPAPKPAASPVAPVTEQKPAARPAMGTLQKIRQEMQARSQANQQSTGTALSEPLLQQAWEGYIDMLTEQKSHTTASNLKMARWTITGDNNFDIYTETVLQQRFIEQERSGLIEHLHRFFNNRYITYQVILDTSAVQDEPTERPMNRKEQYVLMVTEYPLVKELRDRLGLDVE
jgi:DNA polymerase III subunit gamma/tau